MWVADALYDGLVELSPELEIKPAIAKRWEWDEKGVVFHLRKGVMLAKQEEDLRIQQIEMQKTINLILQNNKSLNLKSLTSTKYILNRRQA